MIHMKSISEEELFLEKLYAQQSESLVWDSLTPEEKTVAQYLESAAVVEIEGGSVTFTGVGRLKFLDDKI